MSVALIAGTGSVAPAGPGHTVALGDAGWRVWRSALLRGAGFPIGGLDRFADRELAAAADAAIAEPDARAGFEAAFDAAARRLGRTVHDIAGDPLFREALTWQNPVAVRTMLDPLRRHGLAPKRDAGQREKEARLARYWARYCAKNDSIGFFGPVCWVDVRDDDSAVGAVPGPGLVRRRRTYLEWWTLAALAQRLAADPVVRPWLPCALQPMLSLAGGAVVHPLRGRVPLGRAEAAVLARCDGRPAVEVARQAVADPASGLRREEDALLALESLVEREIVVWGVDLPLSLRAEDVLAERLAAIGDPAARARATAAYRELQEGRAQVAAAAGDADALLAAIDGLGETFSRLADRPASRAAGQTYAGRTVCYEDAVRDLDVAVGRRVLAELAPPLSLLLTSARWLTAALAEAYETALREVYRDLAGGGADDGAPVSLAELWYLAQGMFYGGGAKPADAVAAEFTRRWSELLALDSDAREVRYRSEELADAVRSAFPAERPGWAFGRFHSPDVHILAPSVEAIERGEYGFALGELHAAWVALSSELFVVAHPDPPALREFVVRDVGRGRLHPLLPDTWPRLTARTSDGLRDPGEPQLGFMPAPGADPDLLLPITALTVSDVDGQLTVAAPDGRRWPLVEALGSYLSTLSVDAFKLLGSFRHSPRVTVDRLVVARECWRRELAEVTFDGVRDERRRYLAVRAWRAELGLPERVFVKPDTELKPFYVDLTSPAYVNVLSKSLHTARAEADGPAGLTVSEMLPAAEHAWVPDGAGRRYASELRLQVVDPEPADWTRTQWTVAAAADSDGGPR
jgi:Lantibiotic dehydratase, N terminus